MTQKIKNMAPNILDAIKKSNNILLHCHPYPDMDSIGSVLAMANVLKNMGKNTTIIAGDSKIPKNSLCLPNHEWVLPKNYTQIDPNKYDLFIILDSSSPNQITQLADVIFPNKMYTILIDHHVSNNGYAKTNLIEPTYSSTCQILFDLFTLWKIEIDPDVAICLFVGLFMDTGGFKYPNTTPETLRVASILANINPNYHKLIFNLENNREPIEIEMMGLSLSSIEKYYSGHVAISLIPYEEIKKRNLSKEQAMEGLVADILKSVANWDIVASLVEAEPGITRVSLRTRDENMFDVSLIAKSIGNNGGGHKGAAGINVHKPLNETKKILLKTIAEIFPNLPTN